MGRGRQKAKATRQAREMKYFSPETDYNEHTPMVTWMPPGARDVKYWDLFETMGFAGDTSLIHRTEVLRRYPYDVAPEEISAKIGRASCRERV